MKPSAGARLPQRPSHDFLIRRRSLRRLLNDLLALGLLVAGMGCQDATSPARLPSHLSVTGTVRDTLGLPIIGTIVVYNLADPGLAGGETASQELQADDVGSQELQTDDAGRFRLEVELYLPEADTIFVSVLSPYCTGEYGPPIPVDIRDRTPADTVYQVDLTLRIQAPRPSPTAQRLCAHDRHPDFFFTYSTLLHLDSSLYVAGPSGTLFGGRWIHHTSGSTIGDVGSFTGIVTSPHAPCGPTERLAGAVLPSGQWGALRNLADPSCPVGTLRLAFAPY